MVKGKKVLFLYSHLADYFLNCIKVFGINFPEVEIIFIFQNIDANAPYTTENFNFKLICKKSISHESLLDYYSSFNPDLIFISGWKDPDYLKVASKARSDGKVIILGIDNPWNGGLRQRIACLFSLFYQNRYFTHAWVSGLQQYEFVRRLGYNQKNIALGVYAANLDIYLKASPCFNNNTQFPKLLFVGRLIKEKGLVELCNVFTKLKQNFNFKWNLQLVGNGNLKDWIKINHPLIEVTDFVQPKDLINIANTANAFILPSNYEPWGVVVQEFAAAGLPIIVSNSVNSASSFVKNGYNGFIFNSKKEEELETVLLKLNELELYELEKMGWRSRELAKQNTPEIWSFTLMNFLIESSQTNINFSKSIDKKISILNAKNKMQNISNNNLHYLKSRYKPIIINFVKDENSNWKRLVQATEGLSVRLHIVGNLEKEEIEFLKMRSSEFIHSQTLNKKELDELIIQSHIVFLASTAVYFDNLIIQSQANGRPVIVSSFNKEKELLGETVCYVNPYIPSEIRHAILNILNAKSYRNSLIDSGLKNAENYR